MWSTFPLFCRRPMNPNQGCVRGSRRVWFAKQRTSKGQTGCAAVLKGTALARAMFQRAECLACGKSKHERREKFVFLFWSDICANSELQPSPLHHLMCCSLLHLMQMFSFCLLRAASYMTLKRKMLMYFRSFTSLTTTHEYISLRFFKNAFSTICDLANLTATIQYSACNLQILHSIYHKHKVDILNK